MDCAYISMPDIKLAERLKLPHVSIDVAPVSNRTHLDSKWWLISQMIIGQTPVALSREMRGNSIKHHMAAQGGVIIS